MQQKTTDKKTRTQSPLKVAKRPPLKKRIQKALRWLARLSKRLGIKIRSLPWWADAVTVAVFVFGIYQGTVALVPVIHPDPVVSPSWEDLPISATNRGQFFKLHDAIFFCEVTNITWQTEHRKELMRAVTAAEPLEFVVDRTPATIDPGETNTFPCSLSMHAIAQNRYTGVQLPIVLIHMRIRVEYAINLGIFNWKRTYRSQLFTWRWTSGGFQWLEGDSSDKVAN